MLVEQISSVMACFSRGVHNMDETTTQSLEHLVRRVQRQDLSRGRFIALLTRLGASIAGIVTLLAAPEEARGDVAAPPHPLDAYRICTCHQGDKEIMFGV